MRADDGDGESRESRLTSSSNLLQSPSTLPDFERNAEGDGIFSARPESPPTYLEALQTSRPVFLPRFTRLRRCLTERDLTGAWRGAGGGGEHDRERIESWRNRTSSYFLQRFSRIRLPIIMVRQWNQGEGSGLTENDLPRSSTSTTSERMANKEAESHI